jgi:hypothetical protein
MVVFNLRLQDYWDVVFSLKLKAAQSPFAIDLFPLSTKCGLYVPPSLSASADDGSTDSKQTLNGLFYVNTPELFSFIALQQCF